MSVILNAMRWQYTKGSTSPSGSSFVALRRSSTRACDSTSKVDADARKAGLVKYAETAVRRRLDDSSQGDVPIVPPKNSSQ